MAQQPIANSSHNPEWSPRARLYGMALVITLSYMLIGRLNNDNDSWVQVSLPLSSASLLLISLAAAETYLYVQRVQRDHQELQATRVREIELSQHLAFQRQSTLNQISRALIDKLDVAQISQEVLEQIAQLLEADVVAAWVTEKNDLTHFVLKGTFGFTAHSFEQLEAADWSFPAFDHPDKDPTQIILNNLMQQAPPPLADVCERERIACAVLNPVIRRTVRKSSRQADLVHNEDGFRAGRDRLFQAVRIKIACGWVNIHKDRSGSHVADRIRGSDEGQAGTQDLISGSQVRSNQGEMQGRSARRNRNRVLCAHVLREPAFELSHALALAQPSAA